MARQKRINPYYKSVKEYKKIGKANISRQSSDMILIGFIPSAIIYLLKLFTISISTFFADGAVEYGLRKCFYRNSIGEKVEPVDALDGFKDKFGDSFVAGFIVQIIKEIPYALRVIDAVATIMTLLSVLGIAGFGQSEKYAEMAANITILTTLLCIFTYFMILQYSMTQYILMREQETTALNALRKSRLCMSGYIWKYIKLRLSFLLWGLLALITFGLSNIVSRAFFYGTETAFFNDVYEAFIHNEEEQTIMESITDDKEDNSIGGIYIG